MKIKDEGVSRIVITSDADAAVNEIIFKINDGFEAGRATKQEVVSNLIKRFHKQCTSKDINDMRMLFFDPLQLMEVMLRRAKETGELPDAMREMLFKQYNDSNGVVKKAKKLLKDDVIKDNIEGYEAEDESR